MHKLQLDVEEIVRLYVEEGLRGAAIAKQMGCSDTVIYGRLVDAGVTVSSEASLPKDEVTRLYGEQRWTCTALAVRFGVTPVTIARHLRSWGVPMRTKLEAQQPAGRRPCPRSTVLRAYMLGFATGDLWINRPNVAGQGSTTGVPELVSGRACAWSAGVASPEPTAPSSTATSGG